jgi:ABC-type multidrug transport system fused ATPase/permease subunit
VSTPLGERNEISHARALHILLRALRYLAPFRARVAVKLGFGALSLLPLLLLPWPVKVLVDQVIEGLPVTASKVPWPFFVRPAVGFLDGLSPGETILWTAGFQALLLLLVGAVGTGGREQDQAEAWLASGHDTATRTENEANAGFSLAGGLLGWFDFRWTIRLVQDLNHHYRARLFERIQSLPMAAFDDERIGDALYRVMYDTPSITNGCFRILLTPLLATLMILTTAAVLAATFGSHPALVVSALAVLPLALVATLPFAGTLRRRGGLSRQAGAGTTSTVEEGMANILAVQSLGGEARERARFDRDSWASFSTYRSLLRTVLLAALVGLLPFLLLLGYVFVTSVDLVIAGEVSRGDFVLLLTYFAILAGAAAEIGALWFRVQASAAGLHRVFHLMDLPGERDRPGAAELETVRQGLRLEGVHFAHAGGAEVIHGVDLEARVGRVTALVGPAGAGKTTLAYLLCGFLTPDRERVLVDGRDLRGFRHDSVRHQLAFVFQETALFDDTVEANLRLARPDASGIQMRQALRLAGAEEFVARLPQGLHTRLGRGGGRLSVGQKQRLSVARALLREAPLLVLDEPTSALDPETERRLLTTLREAARSRLVLVIAHRLSTVRAADQICFVERGRIVERGSHAELMARPAGAYRRFVELQTRGAA